MRLMRSSHFSVVTSCARRLSAQSGNASGVSRRVSDEAERLRGNRTQQHAQAGNLKLVIQHFAARLGNEQVLRIILGEDIEENPAGGLELARALAAARVAREDETGNARDIAKLPRARARSC